MQIYRNHKSYSHALRPYEDYLKDLIKYQEQISSQSPFYFNEYVQVIFTNCPFTPSKDDRLTNPNKHQQTDKKELTPFCEKNKNNELDWFLPKNWFKSLEVHQALQLKLIRNDGKVHNIQVRQKIDENEIPIIRSYIEWKKTLQGKSESESKALKEFVEDLVRNPESQNGFCQNSSASEKNIDIKTAGESLELSEMDYWFIFDGFLEGVLYMSVNTYEIKQQLAAVRKLRHSPAKHHEGLLKLFKTQYDLLEDFSECDGYCIGENEWEILTDGTRDGAKEQREFVQKALNTQDFAVLEGPPGSGKTTVILELVLQLLKEGKRILLCSATHVAIDNVLERFLEKQENGSFTDLLIARIARNPGVITNEKVKEKYHLSNIMKELFHRTQNHLKSISDATKGQKGLLEAFEKEEDFQDFVLQHCNLVAGTMVGILQTPAIKNPRAGFKDFDYLIVDEASKVTVHSFLVPAQFAKHWVLVGDVQQLSPYSDDALTVKYLADKLEISTEKAEEITRAMSESYAYRFHKTLSVTKNKLLQNLIRDLTDEQKILLEETRQVAYPSILEAYQKGTSVCPIVEVEHKNNIIHNGFYRQEYLQEYWDSRFTSLTYQHRMTQEIAKIPRTHFYNENNLKTSKQILNRENKLLHYNGNEDSIVWQPIKENGSEKNTNELEVKLIMIELKKLAEFAQIHDKKLEVAVLTFYRGQERLLRKKLKGYESSVLDVSVCTVDRFQGKEADVVLLCFTKWNGVPFYNVPNRLNVALTRAKYKLILFGNPNEMQKISKSEAIKALCQQIYQRT